MRILFWSNAPTVPSGYGVGCKLFAPRIKALGHDVGIFGFAGVRGSPMQWEEMIVYPTDIDKFGNDIVAKHAQHFRADVVISLTDVLIVQPQALGNYPWVPWVTIDADPIRPMEVAKLKAAYQPVAYSLFGQKMAQNAGIDARYVPLGTDCSVFCPGDKREARERTGLPQDRFIVGMVAANQGSPSRKAFGEHFKAFAQFKRRHPDALLYLHTRMSSVWEGHTLARLAESAGLTKSDYVTVSQYHYACGMIDDEQMTDIYRSLDVLANVAYCEGFGLTILEAQSCGTPVITGDWSSMPEITFGGWQVRESETLRAANRFDTFWWIPDCRAIADRMEAAYQELSPIHGKMARAGALEYDATSITERYWRPVLDEIAHSSRVGAPA